MYPETAVIVRTRNEARWLGETLTRLQSQTYQDFEIIIVDSGSTDETLTIAGNFPVKIVSIPQASFTYPYAINVGIKNSTATKYYVMLSAHSLPFGEDWLETGIRTLDNDPKACGLYGPLKAMPDGTIMDYLVHNTWHLIESFKVRRNRFRLLTTYESGALGFTNAIIRKDLYQAHPIDEAYAGGGEDT